MFNNIKRWWNNLLSGRNEPEDGIQGNSPITNDIFLNSDGTFMDHDQIVNDILANRLDPSTREFIKNNYTSTITDEQKQIQEYTGLNIDNYKKASFARWIRNAYGLWSQDNPHVIVNAKPNKNGVLDHPLFPDNYSENIMDTLAKRIV